MALSEKWRRSPWCSNETPLRCRWRVAGFVTCSGDRQIRIEEAWPAYRAEPPALRILLKVTNVATSAISDLIESSSPSSSSNSVVPVGRKLEMNHSEIVSFIWGVADLIRDTFKRGKYQDVILPFTVLRRLDCVLAPTKERSSNARPSSEARSSRTSTPSFARLAGFAFYNTSRYDFEKLLADAPHLAANLRNYIAGFSPNMREVLEKFDFDNTISKLDEAGPALPGPGALQERRPPPGHDRQPHHGHDLRGAHPQVQRGAERESRASTSRPVTSST